MKSITNKFLVVVVMFLGASHALGDEIKIFECQIDYMGARNGKVVFGPWPIRRNQYCAAQLKIRDEYQRVSRRWVGCQLRPFETTCQTTFTVPDGARVIAAESAPMDRKEQYQQLCQYAVNYPSSRWEQFGLGAKVYHRFICARPYMLHRPRTSRFR